MGARRSAEALAQQINQVYTALVAEVERWHGSVISIAGASLTCWFDPADGAAAPRAAACALALQQAMAAVNQVALPSGAALTLGLRVALTSGPVRRFAVGDPQLQQFDVLAGQTLTRAARIAQRTQPGEVLLDQATAEALDSATLGPWRDDPHHTLHYALLAGLAEPPALSPWPALPHNTPGAEQLRPWLLPALFQRYQDALGDFLTELRPLVGVFICFAGLDYDHDPGAAALLDTFARTVQQALARYEGALLQITVGDQGSLLYAAFGAPLAHEDDLLRAALAALDIHQAAQALGTAAPLQIGICQGTLIVGMYGAATRLTYAGLGDAVTLAARLMLQAAPGETLLSGRVQRALSSAFVLEPRTSIWLQGRAEPLPVLAVLGRRQPRPIRLQEPAYALPMVGRSAEVRRIGLILDTVMTGTGRVLAISGEAGLGKSRLVAETIRLARQRGLIGYGGACQTTGTNTPYLVWEPIWRAFFDIDPETSLRKQARVLEGALEDLAPERVEMLPLLGPLLGLSLPDNEITRMLQPKDRRGALHALLCDCLAAAAREAQADGGGLLLVLEDLHWIDSASLQLLVDLTEALAALPVLVVLAYRPTEQVRLLLGKIEALPCFSHISLEGLESTAAENLIRAKLAQLFPARSGALLPALVARLTERAQGNPFYLEELLNYLHDRAINPYNAAAIEALELPDSLYSLVLSRLDQLSSQQQTLLKMASVIGRRFPVAWLHGAFAGDRPLAELEQEMAALASTELIALDTSEPEPAYLFRHVVTQQVVYESLSASTRSALHERLAAYLEVRAGADQEPYLDSLAYHYDQSAQQDKQRHFHLLAAQAALRHYANESALAHFSRVLELTPEDALEARFDVLLARERVYHLVADRQRQKEDIEALLKLLEHLDDPVRRIAVMEEQVFYLVHTGQYDSVEVTARLAVDLAEQHAVPIDLAVYREWGVALSFLGRSQEGKEIIETGLRKAEQAGRLLDKAKQLNSLAVILLLQGEYQQIPGVLSLSLSIIRDAGDRREEVNASITMLYASAFSGNMQDMYNFGYQALYFVDVIGDRYLKAWVLLNFGTVLCYLGYFSDSQSMLEQARGLSRAHNDINCEGAVCSSLGMVYNALGKHEQAQRYYEKSIDIAERLQNPFHLSERLAMLGLTRHLLGDHHSAAESCQQSLAISAPAHFRHEQAIAYTFLARIQAALVDADQAEELYLEALNLRQTLQQSHLINEPRAGLAAIAQTRYEQTGHEHQRHTALAHVEAILPHIEDWNLAGTHDPLEICGVCHRVLSAAGDVRAHTVLRIAHTELLRRAATITDESARARYLARPPHPEIIEAYGGAV